MQRSVLITGAGGGLGRNAAERLATKGWLVFAADYNQKALDAIPSNSNIVPIVVDVCDQSSVDRLKETLENRTDRLDGVVNFAGILGVGSVIEIDEADLRRVYDVNVLGTYRINKACFELVKSCQGRIINISSETGWQSAAPFNGPYAMSKHAIEAYSDALRRELALFGVRVIKIQPGPFETNMTGGVKDRFEQVADNSIYFGDVIRKLVPFAVKETQDAHDPAILSAVIEKALTAANPKPAYSVKPAPSRSFLEKLPVRWADYLYKRTLSR